MPSIVKSEERERECATIGQAKQDNLTQADAAVMFSPVTPGIVVTADQTTTVNIS